MSTGRGLGYLPDPVKEGDHDWASFKLVGTQADRPADNRAQIVEVLDQGPLGSCVANAGFQAVRMMQRRQSGQLPPLGARLWGYYLARAFIGTTKIDSGSHIRDFFRGLNKYGFLREDQYAYRYDLDHFTTPPPPLAYLDAFARRDRGVTRYLRISSEGEQLVRDVCQAISAGYPVVFGSDVSFEFCNLRRGFKVFDPPRPNDVAGGHAMCLVGHGLAGGRLDTFTAVGSWGTDAHDEGFHHFSFEYAIQCFRDIWVVQSAPEYLPQEATS